MSRFDEFRDLATKLVVVSLAEVRNFIPGLRQETLYRWRRKGMIEVPARGFYQLPGALDSEARLMYAANRIYSPSYVSLDFAMRYHGLVTEEVFSITSVSTRKTREAGSDTLRFSYRKVKPAYFFGYESITCHGVTFLLAEPEKALIDMIYLTDGVRTSRGTTRFRLDNDALQGLNHTRLISYAQRYPGPGVQAAVRRIMESCDASP